MKSVALARTFLAYSYALAYQIKNKNQSDLFQVTQSLLEFSIERFDKYIDDHPIKLLVDKNEGNKPPKCPKKIIFFSNFFSFLTNFYLVGHCISVEYSKIKAEMSNFGLNMTIQFKNSRREFMSKEFKQAIKNESNSFLMHENAGEGITIGGGKKPGMFKKFKKMFFN